MDIEKCPYCDNLIPQLGLNNKGCYVECEKCGSRTGYFPTSTQAIKEWNAGNNNNMICDDFIQKILKIKRGILPLLFLFVLKYRCHSFSKTDFETLLSLLSLPMSRRRGIFLRGRKYNI